MMQCDVDWVGLGWVKVGRRFEGWKKKKRNGKGGESCRGFGGVHVLVSRGCTRGIGLGVLRVLMNVCFFGWFGCTGFF